MEKIAIVSALIANALGIFEESEREALMTLEEADLQKTLDRVTTLAAKDAAVTAPEPEAAPAVTAPSTAAEYIAAAPPEIRDVLANSLAVHEAQRADLVTKITANAANTFSKEFLATKGLAELQGLAALAAPAPAPVANGLFPAHVPMFMGQATMNAAPVVNGANGADDCLPLPTMNFETATV